ncbi:polyamine ABC transporter substrate-binding protein [Sphaerotilus montanus]|uniref:Putrescine-binding periplasmic protein n=1 Tax=Sphaerotilus montanus TaxID=522889 RepID=A0A7Y9R085_9BURK|nr:polyamine ABC transporter substrate-binding protein [Sphaerotilus montanus]NYG34518.1 putrescine transport system substrate-binding protein [Sphaerotilus montanus]NZD55631.1 polyamine ABC transporter substrate-binding protein [Sphaerotilus montanus]
MKLLSSRPAKALNVLVAAVAVLCSAGVRAEEEKVLNIYNWSDYIAEDTIKNFEKETGIKVRYDFFDSNESLHAKLIAGKTGYDIVVPGSNWAKSQIEAGLLMKLDKSKIPNLANLDPAIQAQLAKMDPGNDHIVDWLWGYTTVGINVDKVKKALGDKPMPDNAWDLVFNADYASKLKSCGVAVLDTPSEIMPLALNYLGKDPHSKNADDYKAAGEMLKKVRPSVTRFVGSGSDYIDQMAKGQICAVVGWSGDIMIAKDKSQKAKKPQNLEVLLPKNGGLLFFDTMAIPKDAKHPENAHKWINYILKPEVHASLTNTVFYANPNKASLKFVKPELAKDPAVFPDEAALGKMIPPGTPDQATRKLITRTFTNFKAGR